jgi:hypothetical protein
MKIVKISLKTNVKNAIDYLLDLFKNNDKEVVYICALSLAISKLILIVEIIKTQIKNLHQVNNIDCLIKNINGVIKRVPKMEVIISKIEPIAKGLGYQCPMDNSEVEKIRNYLQNEIREQMIRKSQMIIRGKRVVRGSHFKISSKYSRIEA